MEIVISILIASVISLGISIYFHEVDKRNNAIEKVRRYADKREADLSDHYKKVEHDFNMLVTEFDSRQSQANAAVKLLSQEHEGFLEKIKVLEQYTQSIDNIGAQINNYSRLLNDLNDMTGQVEENLKRIQKESTIVNNLTNSLNKQQHTIDTIEKRIPEISDKFTTYNADQLKAVASTLLDEYKAYADGLAAENNATKANAEKDFKWLLNLNQRLFKLALIFSVFEFVLIPFLPFIIRIWLGSKAITVNYLYALFFAIFGGSMLFQNVVSTITKAKPATVKGQLIQNITISSTMGPGIKVDKNSFDI